MHVEHDATFEIKCREDFIDVFLECYGIEHLLAIITSAPQAKFRAIFNQKTWKNYQNLVFLKLLNLFGIVPGPPRLPQVRHRRNLFNFRVVFFQKIEENYSSTVIMAVTKKCCRDGDNFCSVKVTVMRTLSFSQSVTVKGFSPESVTCHRLSLYCTGNWVRYNYNLSPLSSMVS